MYEDILDSELEEMIIYNLNDEFVKIMVEIRYPKIPYETLIKIIDRLKSKECINKQIKIY